MNTYLKIASAAALSVVTLSVAALSVPSIKAHALKLIEEVSVKLAHVEHVTVKNKGVGGASVVGEVLQIGNGDLKPVEIPSVSVEKGDDALAVFAGAVDARSSNSQASLRVGSGSTRGSGGLSSPNGLAVAGLAPHIASRAGGRIMDGPGTGPVGAGAPGLEAGAPADDLPSVLIPEQILDNGGESSTPPTSTAPGSPGTGDPKDEIFDDIADLPPQPDFGPNSPDAVLPIALDVGAFARIPEPGTLALLGVALLGVGAFRRRRANR
ncbi:PEP-CTERM sorting domain-containing protein [Hydrogenophaga sp.]|uniref:PEP-CTERM sorting domain-containing protein n=1 Tax=Hydrogenophaga sp. TaxID=1904254 RepID=UPI0027306868|nr:PEP-CTERM sorting domain-containing protein [Hydrogenophaga sp.]MDP2016411.1 PEP-CTERM sorting domain-containing protein [Hydrogenophaga sp.]MDP3166168.1 PEP-CTERM sorting domain-containing protein [Hydrogenophaga sp.]MDP3812333.1 PEP-CTERM sorting domain-containing protein [Hydrogenophaga sp.]